MRDEPDALGLLAVARETLLGELMPLLPAERRYDALLIASAMAAAAREIEAGGAPLREELDGLARLLDLDPAALTPADLPRLNARLAAEIRAGAHDRPGPARAALAAHLKAATVRKLRETNPKYLAAEGLG
ncbi:MAG TPA: DUF6285 domain-containing protein [Geminicoccaceae bacterium]|nr:DUF6285 domain-containing protein [Geminicoccaceae bacterium]